jgi:nitrogen fixation/metabolism regulation signal transduction histidine kinase
MDAKKSHFNQILLIILIVLYLLSIAAFSYLNWAADPSYVQWLTILLNALILSIPLILMCGSIYVLVVAWREHAATHQVSPRLAKIIHWAPALLPS